MRRFGAAYFDAEVSRFVDATAESILGTLVMSSGDDTYEQKAAWQDEISILQAALRGRNGHLFLEFTVPRIGDRIDAVLLTNGIVVPIEFKVGANRFSTADINQAWDYALDLKNFHRGSRDAEIVPILVATEARVGEPRDMEPYADLVHAPILTNAVDLSSILDQIRGRHSPAPLDPVAWEASPYAPTPTIIEAARTLYSSHSVNALACNEAGRIQPRSAPRLRYASNTSRGER